MTALQLAVLFNTVSIGLVLAVSLAAVRRFRHPIFQLWIGAHAWELVSTLADTIARDLARPVPLTLLTVVAGALSIWYLVQTGRTIHEKPLAGWTLGAFAGATTLAGGLALALGAKAEAVLVPAALVIPLALLYLGWAFLRYRGPAAHAATCWIGVPLIVRGTGSYGYALLLGTPHEWAFFGLSALMHVLTGLGMVLFLAVDTLEQLNERNQALREKNEALLALDRLKDGFVATLSHELRTPLTAIRGAAELLSMRVLAPDDQARFLGVLERNAQHLEHLFQDMLDYARIQSNELGLHVEERDLAAIARDAADESIERFEERGVALSLELEPVVCRCDGERIRQVLRHLLSNAAKFSQAGSTVRLRVYVADGAARLEVADQGIGVAPGEHEKIFDRYYQSDSSSTRRHGGVGLGLAISRAIMDGHGGRIWVESGPGGGSTFVAALPLAAAVPLAP